MPFVQLLLVVALLSGCKLLAGPPPGAQNWPFSQGPRSYDVALGDLDGDGDLDAYLANGENEVPVPDTVWFNDGQGRFADSGQQIGDHETLQVLLADIDLDGDLDALAAGTSGLLIYHNDGKGDFASGRRALEGIRGGYVPVAPAVGDLNGDGYPDVIAGGCCSETAIYADNHRVSTPPVDTLWLSDGQGGFVDSGQVFDVYGTTSVALGDLDGDGHLDAYFANAASNVDRTETIVRNQPDTVWFGDGQGRFRPGDQQLGKSEAEEVALGDLDGDGDLDAFVGLLRGPAEIWVNAGGAQGGEPGTFFLGGTPGEDAFTRSIELADVDGDGDLDALVAYQEEGRFWINDGLGDFSAGQELAFEVQHGLALGDLNGDGHVDVFAGSIYQGILVWFNDGAGRFAGDGG
jgi:hypothetical protein